MNENLRKAIEAADAECYGEPDSIREDIIAKHVEPVFADLQRDNAELRELLRSMANTSDASACIFCGERLYYDHKANCRLAKAITPREGEDKP